MPNHAHTIHYFPDNLIGNAKRFMAYEIVNRLEEMENENLLDILDKAIYTQNFFNQKPDYIHLNPVSGKWKLVDNYTKYEYSSASFYSALAKEERIDFNQCAARENIFLQQFPFYSRNTRVYT